MGFIEKCEIIFCTFFFNLFFGKINFGLMRFILIILLFASCEAPIVKPKGQEEIKLINLKSNVYYTIQVKANDNTWYPSYLPILK